MSIMRFEAASGITTLSDKLNFEDVRPFKTFMREFESSAGGPGL
jgi:hypothetical protein